MDERAERTVIISSRELVEHAILTRRRSELQFKRDLLIKSGAKEGDLHLKAVDDELAHVESKLKPIGEKLAIADMITLVPARKEIFELTQQINKFSRAELEWAIKNKAGAAYDLMKRRAALIKNNYEKKEDIARLTILLNTLPRKEGEALRSLIEENAGQDVDVSFLPKEKQQELVNLASRIGRQCCVFAGSFSIDKKKVENAELKPEDEVKRQIGSRIVWVNAKRLQEFEENEKLIAQLLSKIQAKSAEKQSRTLTEEETVYFEKLQSDYLAALQKRGELVKGFELSETAKVYKKAMPSENEEY